MLPKTLLNRYIHNQHFKLSMQSDFKLKFYFLNYFKTVCDIKMLFHHPEQNCIK